MRFGDVIKLLSMIPGPEKSSENSPNSGAVWSALRMPAMAVIAAGAIFGVARGLSEESPADVATVPAASAPTPLDAQRVRIEELRTRSFADNLFQEERSYARLTERETLQHMLALYKAEAEGKVDVVLAGFAPPGEGTSPDRGYGPLLRVVKRFRETLPDGSEGVTFVNEHWHVNAGFSMSQLADEGGLFAPDEIRVHYLAFKGERGMPNSSALHVYDRFRIAWDVREQPLIYRQHLYDRPANGESEMQQIRVQVGTHSCMSCHGVGDFLTEGIFGPFNIHGGSILEEHDHESIVPTTLFGTEICGHPGYRHYLKYLEQQDAPKEFITRVREGLEHGAETLRLPNMVPMLENRLADPNMRVHFLEEDYPAFVDAYQPRSLHVYQPKEEKQSFTDAIEADLRDNELQGIYTWWYPPTIFPQQEEK